MTRLLVRPTIGREEHRAETGEWYKLSYRRHLLDMHIEDWDDRFLSRYDPKDHVRMLKLGNVKSAMVYANSHVGHCYWPTKAAHMHRGLKGRDVLGELIDLCHAEGLDVIVYYSLIYNNWAYAKDPEWRIVDVDGKGSREGPRARYGVCCPNARGYREFVLSQIEELCPRYDFEAIFFDMTFWPKVCYCSNCRKRFKLEAGEDLPTTIDWGNASWLRFQQKREQWLAEFAQMATSAVKKLKPMVAVEHQHSTVGAPWPLGVTDLLAEQCDYVGGDFYGGVLQQSFVCKLYQSLSPSMPFEFMTSICHPGLKEHTTTKSRELLENKAFLTIAHGGAVLMIDAVDPEGTMEESRYEKIGQVFARVREYEEFLGGELCADIAVYFSFDSKMSFAENGRKVGSGARDAGLPHVEAVLGVTAALRANHIPFGVISRKNLQELSRYQVLVLPNVLRLSDEEADLIIEYLKAGGRVYASKFSARSKLAGVLGISGLEETKEKVTYVAPTPLGAGRLPGITSGHPLSVSDAQLKASLSDKEGILATIVLPYSDPADSSRFASIHSNPPGVATEYPAILRRELGEGVIIWSAASIEERAAQSAMHASVFSRLVESLAAEPFLFQLRGPACIEVVEFRQPREKRYLVNIVNFQSETGAPNIPVTDLVLKVRLKDKPKKVMLLPDRTPLAFNWDGCYATIEVPKVETFRMMAVDYE